MKKNTAVKTETQWTELGKGVYRASNVTFETLETGTYEIQYRDQIGLVYVKRNIKTDKLIEFPDMVQDTVVKGISEFWQKKDVFAKFGQLHKRGVFIYGPPGCHPAGTQVIKFDGSLVKVEDVQVGDSLIGPDSKPRKVLELIRGVGDLYKVIPVKGKPFIVNEDHILALHPSGSAHSMKSRFNMSVRDFLKQPKDFQTRSKLYRSEVIHWGESAQELPIPPYILGLWLGDGSTNEPALTSADPEPVTEWKTWAAAVGSSVREHRKTSSKATTYSAISSLKDGRYIEGSNPARNVLKELNLLGNKHIPSLYKTASVEHRLELLAGLLDSDGHLGGKCFDFISKSKDLSDDVLFIARSLGFAAYQKSAEKGHTYLGKKKIGTFWRLSISGDCSKIPTRIDRKKSTKRLQVKDHLVSGFSIEPAGVGGYYGFILNEDHLYLLDDFTVTHNSGKTCTVNLLSKKLVDAGGIVLYCNNPHLATEGLRTLRKIEPDRALIYIMEDIDEILRQYGDSALLSLLDGENKVENIVFVATSNFPEMLSERFLDRPSRFDERIEVGMPSAQARSIYLRSVLDEETLPDRGLREWVEDTENFSIAHLRELFVSVYCLGRDYAESVSRLRGMSTLPKSKTRKKQGGKLGFGDASSAEKSIEKFYASNPPSVLVPMENRKK